MGFHTQEELKDIQENRWKFTATSENQELPRFRNRKVTKKGNIYHFEFLNMEYDEEYNELTVEGEDIEINGSLQPKNKAARQEFTELNTSKYPDKQIFKELRRYIKEARRSNKNPVEDINYLINVKKASRRNDDLIQAVAHLFKAAGLKKTYNRYVMPMQNNVCCTISKNEMLEFIDEVCDIELFSTDTLDSVLTYFNKEYVPSYHKIVLENGYYDFETCEFHTEAKEEIIINKTSPYTYDEELIGLDQCPPILKKFLEQTFQDDLNKIIQLLEIYGYYLDDGNPFQLLISFVGPPRSGKSVSLELGAEMLGGSQSDVDILASDFDSKYVQSLADSHINLMEEITKIKNIAKVKKYTGQGGLELARIYEAPRHYTDLELPKTLIASNDFSDLHKKIDQAMIERMRCFLEFVNGIDDSSKRNPHLVKDIKNEENAMNWLLTNSIYQYSLIRKEGRRLSAEKTSEEFIYMLSQYSNPVIYALRQEFVYDVSKWEELFDDGKFDELVTLDDARECIYKEKPTARINSTSTIRDKIMEAFQLQNNKNNEYAEEDDDYKGYYHIRQKYDEDTGKVIGYIEGLLRRWE